LLNKNQKWQTIFRVFIQTLIITEHFALIINKIDIQNETLLCDQTLTKERIGELNKTRQEQIDKIKEIEQLNLDKNRDLNLNEYEETWTALINEPSMDFEQKVDIIKHQLISADCVLLEQPKSLNGFNLWITSEFYNKHNLAFLK
jgi:hypothetical protein